jgi:predicted phage gp36 major capsid-like protein
MSTIAVEEQDRAAVDRLEQVDAAQQRALARATGADEADHLVLADRERHVVEDDLVPNDLRTLLDRELRAAAGMRSCDHRPTGAPRCRWMYQSTSRVSGIVSEEDQRRHDQRGEVPVEVLARVRAAEHLDDADEAEQRDVLLQRQEVVHQRRDHPSRRLGRTTKRIVCPCDSPKERARGALALVDALDAGERNTSATYAE